MFQNGYAVNEAIPQFLCQRIRTWRNFLERTGEFQKNVSSKMYETWKKLEKINTYAVHNKQKIQIAKSLYKIFIHIAIFFY